MLDEMVHIPELLVKAGLTPSVQVGRRAVIHGDCYVERWNIGISEINLPRWVLRGVEVRVGDKSARISECGYKILRDTPALA